MSTEETVLQRLAARLWRCRFCSEIVELASSTTSINAHLSGLHGAAIFQSRRIARQQPVELPERPQKLYCCTHCDFVVPPDPDDAYGSIQKHIEAAHPNVRGPIHLSLRVSDNESEIDCFVQLQKTEKVCFCNYPACDQHFPNVAGVAEHWAVAHREGSVTVDEARNALDSNPGRFRTALSECFAEVAEEAAHHGLSIQEPDDGYPIRHSPNVPRIRSAPSESIIYIGGETGRLPDEEIEALRAYEGLDVDDETAVDQWQTVKIELRFCNIEDGYIPLIKEVCSILPRLEDGEMIEVLWQDESESFPCKVSKRKRAIYNREGRLKDIFEKLDSGVRLYIKRVGAKQYRLHLNRQPHIVPNCKFFVPLGESGWRIEVRDVEVDWETSNDVFRHQMTFEQMEALRDEARLSVRDAVYKAMKQMAQGAPVHVRHLYEPVFLSMRICSLAAVWAQFRPEHECYERVGPGWYRFNPTKQLPTIRRVTAQVPRLGNDSASISIHRQARTRIRIFVHWSQHPRFSDRKDKEFKTNSAAETMANFIGSLIRAFGGQWAERLTSVPVSGNRPLSKNPILDSLIPGRDTTYRYTPIAGTDLFLFTTTSNQQKCDDIRRLVDVLGFPPAASWFRLFRK